MRFRTRLALAAVILGTLGGPSQAALDGSCTIMVTRQGTMRTNPDISVLSSKQTGGRAALASITITPGLLGLTCSLLQILVCHQLSVVPPLSFSNAPTGGGTGVAFTTTMRIDGSPVDYPQVTPVTVLNGAHSVEVDLTATRSTGAYPAGDYQGVVTLRCE